MLPINPRLYITGSVKLKSVFVLSVLAASLCAAAPSLHAATVTVGSTSPVTVGSGQAAPGSSANYYFFGGPAPSGSPSPPNAQTTFTLSSASSSQYNGTGSTSYSVLQPPGGGTSFVTGIAYAATTTNAATASLATFTTGALTGSVYSVYVLFGNTDLNVVQDGSIGLSINNGAFTTIAVTDVKGTNDFVRFDVTGAQQGDTLTFEATAAGQTGGTYNRPYIGGVTFTTPVPEPATWLAGALCISAGATVLRRRVRA